MNLSPVAYGCWRFATNTFQQADRLIRTALDAGLSTIDTADIYGMDAPGGFGSAEALLGKVLAAEPALRGRMQLLTKGGITPPRPYDSSRGYLMGALEHSLRRLGVERVDLYQIHRPDLTTPMAELAATLDAMVENGKVAAVGVSNFTPGQTRALRAHLQAPLATLQPEFSALEQGALTDGTLDLAEEIGACVLAWSPLGGGQLFREDGAVQAALSRIAEERGLTLTQAALAFTRSTGGQVVPIIGTQTPARVEEAAGAMGVRLSAREFYDVVEAYRGAPMP